MYLSPWISLPLVLCISTVYTLKQFPKKFEVRQMGDSLSLNCHGDFQDAVTWKQKLGDQVTTVTESKFVDISDGSLHLRSLDTPNAGEYSCWEEGRKVDQTYLFLEEVNEDDYDDDDDHDERVSFSCSAQTYSCFFTCHLFASGFTAARLRYQSGSQGPAQWYHASSSEGNFQFTIDLDLSYSPYSEESAAMKVTVEAVNSKNYLKRTLPFYLRDIVQPDPPQIVKCEWEGQMLNVTVEPPESWAQPLSYFPLEHEIEFILRDNGNSEVVASSLIPQKVSRLRARSRDPLTLSAWSKWSPWRNVTSRKKINKEKGKSGGTVRLPYKKNDTVICRKKKMGRKTSRRNRKQPTAN